MRQINLDMDGTFVDLYGVDNWLEKLTNKDASPYEEAKPLVNLSSLARVLNNLQKKGYRICVISWLAKNSTKEYNKKVTTAKKNWLKKHLKSVHFDDVKIVPYGTPKSTCGTGILFDDEKPNRNEWQGIAFDAENLVADLRKLA